MCKGYSSDWFGIVKVNNKAMDTIRMFINIGLTLTPTCVRVSCHGQAMFGHQVGVWHHVGATIVVVWHCMGV